MNFNENIIRHVPILANLLAPKQLDAPVLKPNVYQNPMNEIEYLLGTDLKRH